MKYVYFDILRDITFNHCNKHKGLSKNYILKVAESWFNKGIINSFQLDSYFTEYQKFYELRQLISKKLNLRRNFTEYEEEIIEKWVMEFKYGFDVPYFVFLGAA